MKDNDRVKALLLAPACDGTDVGEAWSSFQWAQHLAQRCDVVVLSQRKRGRAALAPQLPDTRVVEWLEPRGLSRFERFNSMAKPGYLAFFLRARAWMRANLRRDGIQVVHQLAPLALRYPTPALGMGVPWIMGPVGGSLAVPRPLREVVGRDAWLQRLRGVDGLRMRLDPWLRATYRQAAAVVGVAPYVRDLLPSAARSRFVVSSETGLATLPKPSNRRSVASRLRLLFVGRLVPTKGLRLALMAVAQLGDRNGVHLDVVGTGPELEPCKALASKLGIDSLVHFHGRVARAQVEQFYTRADVFLFPSVREPSGNVVFEALSHGLPVITCRHGGPGHVVDETCGFAVEPAEAPAFCASIAERIARLRADVRLRKRLGDGGRKRVAVLGDFGVRADAFAQLYRRVVSGSATRVSRAASLREAF